MEYLKYAFICVLGVFELVVMIFAVKSGKPLKTILINAIAGLAALAVINLSKTFTGVFVPVNPISVTLSGSMGIPGVIGLIISRFIFV